jgi:hypothetical protein
MMKQADALRLFGLTNLSIEADVRRVEVEQKVDFGHRRKRQQSGDEDFYKQFSVKLREEAEAMARHYVIFYCLENSIRELITARLGELHGETWWDQSVPQSVRENCKKNRDRELASGITVRSEYMIDYSTFGELGEILKANSETFGDMLRDLAGVQRILSNLNTLRGPIAHCKPLADDEVVRLHLGLSDWFRQMS